MWLVCLRHLIRSVNDARCVTSEAIKRPHVIDEDFIPAFVCLLDCEGNRKLTAQADEQLSFDAG